MAQRAGKGKMVILSAPSGAGKTTIMKHIIRRFPTLEFSVSATSRPPRGAEEHGKDYYFFSAEEFAENIRNDRFVEWEEVYTGTHYGTLRSEVERIWNKGNCIIFDVDVKGGLRLKELFGDTALSVFIMPPSVEELRHRLTGRGTETPEAIDRRVEKAAEELGYADRFDHVIVNDDLGEAIAAAEKVIGRFLDC